MSGPIRLIPLAMTLALTLSACGGAQASSASPVTRETASIQALLVAGPWRLADYRPTLTLEPMMQALLAQQLRTMQVRFDGHLLTAVSPTVNITRPYSLENVAGLAYDLVSPDLQGGGYLRSRCQMSDDGRRITFAAQTDPWAGYGIIEREAP